MRNPLATLFMLGVVVFAWMYYQHENTGKWSLLPVELTKEEKQLFAWEKRLAKIEKELNEYRRIAALSGEKAFYDAHQKELRQEREDLLVKIKRLRALIEEKRREEMQLGLE
jgi:hypothetical protein